MLLLARGASRAWYLEAALASEYQIVLRPDSILHPLASACPKDVASLPLVNSKTFCLIPESALFSHCQRRRADLQPVLHKLVGHNADPRDRGPGRER
jgi:hypothetical protein